MCVCVYVCVNVCMFVSVCRIETSIVWVKCPQIGLVADEAFLGFAASLGLGRSFE